MIVWNFKMILRGAYFFNITGIPTHKPWLDPEIDSSQPAIVIFFFKNISYWKYTIQTCGHCLYDPSYYYIPHYHDVATDAEDRGCWLFCRLPHLWGYTHLGNRTPVAFACFFNLYAETAEPHRHSLPRRARRRREKRGDNEFKSSI